MEVKVTQSCLTLGDPMDYTVHRILQDRILGWVVFPFSRGSFQPRDGTQSSALQADSLPAEPPGKPKNTGMGSLALFQCIFPTQESNRGFLHCRQILYQLSYLLGRETISGPHPFITRHRLNFFFLCGENMLYSYDLADWD